MKNLNVYTSFAKTQFRLLILILTGLFSAGTFAQADEDVFTSTGSTPWQLYLGSSSNWMVPVHGPETTSHKSKVVTVRTIDNQATADAIQAEWKGDWVRFTGSNPIRRITAH